MIEHIMVAPAATGAECAGLCELQKRVRRRLGVSVADLRREGHRRNARDCGAFLRQATVRQGRHAVASLAGQGAEIRTTRSSENSGFKEYNEKYQNKPVHLFAITDKGRLRVFARDVAIELRAGWKVISMIPADALEYAASDKKPEENTGAGKTAARSNAGNS